MSWDTGSWEPDVRARPHEHLAPMTFVDGPPWSEDEDLQSPVVSSRHRKHKSSSAALGLAREQGQPRQTRASVMDPSKFDRERGYFVGTGGDGSERYYVNQGGEANGPGGEFVTYPPGQARRPSQYLVGEPRQYAEHEGQLSDSDASSASSPGFPDDSRYSRDYQFTITSPDEEMHGKAVALFDFERENENELPLVEGQIIWVSYRHGQGWLVAEDPKTRESGLVPEEYVRLLRDIEGGMNSLTGSGFAEGTTSPNEVGTPTQADHAVKYEQQPPVVVNNPTNGYHQPVVSTFSTSSKDLDPYPTQQLVAGQPPPQVVHYHGQRGGSQANTPTLSSHQDLGLARRGSQDPAGKGNDLPAVEVTDVSSGDRAATPKADTSTQDTAEAMDVDR